ncbi:MAG TPA: winged helix DNA-binding domain-containing protein [Pilimelia sp.]|nr:winged helix DNA-binding domain-containing protein [Pilimelia sp.]
MTALLTRRALNRATLARQMLLSRWRLTVPEAIERLVGLQAQTPHTWYVGLWARLAGLRPEPVADLLVSRELVRIALMRSTIHLVTARDALALRPLVQPVLERSMTSNFGRHLIGLDRDELVAAGRAAVDAQPLTFSELGRVLAERWPERDAASLAQAVRAWVPLVQVPPRGVWGASGQARHTSIEAWLGRSVTAEPDVDDTVLRYLAAFGPATVRDVQTWSGLTRLGEVVDRLRPRLATFGDEHGHELFDLPDAPRPDPDTPAPARFLYDFDNLLLSHADRGRVITDEARQQEFPDGVMPATFLVDGFTRGTWTVARQRGAATLTIRPFSRLSTADAEAVTAEGRELLSFVAADAAHDVRVLVG